MSGWRSVHRPRLPDRPGSRLRGLAVATVMAGLLLVALGFARIGSVIKFVPYPVTVGFTSGIALIIAASQVRDFFGLEMSSVPADFLGKWAAFARAADTVNPSAVAIAVASLGIILLWPRVTHRVPGSLVAILVTTVAVRLLELPVDTIGSRFGAVPAGLPRPHLPLVDPGTVRDLVQPAFAIAMLGAIESLLSAVVADGMTGRRHRSNMELVAQGIANLLSPIFGGIPATGAIARTATNIKNGGRTPIAGLVHAGTLLLILMSVGPWAAQIPMATLSAVLLVVAYNMSEWRHFQRLFRAPRSDVLVLLSTFALTVLVDLTVAIEIGMVLASFLFMRRMSGLAEVGHLTHTLGIDEEEDDEESSGRTRTVPPGVEVFEISGPFFFGAADKFKSALHQVERPPAVLILRMRRVETIDATGVRALEQVFEKAHREHSALILSGVHPRTRRILERAGLIHRIGEDRIRDDLDQALVTASEILAERRSIPGIETPRE
ncbi:MAG: SulP family inorganic anion transporter [Candidatus Eisenbacteria bacterium]